MIEMKDSKLSRRSYLISKKFKKGLSEDETLELIAINEAVDTEEMCEFRKHFPTDEDYEEYYMSTIGKP